MAKPPPSDDGLVFLSRFSLLKDPRRHQHKVVYPLPLLLLIGFSAALCGLKDWEAAADFAEEKREWLRSLWPFDGDETPSADTLERVFSRLDAKVFRDCFVAWMHDIVRARGGDPAVLRQLVLDGKSIQGARDPSAPTVPLHLVHAFLVDSDVIVGMAPVNGAPGEPKGAEELLAVLELRGTVITGDANFLTRDVADTIVERGGAYMFALKGNRGPAHEAVKRALLTEDDRISEAGTTSAISVYDSGEETGHGRIERRRAFAFPAAAFPAVTKYLAHAQTVLLLERARRPTAEALHFDASTEVSIYVSSLRSDAGVLAGYARNHWSIENQLHRSLDVVLHEDKTAVAKGEAAENLATLRRIALATLRHDTTVSGSAPKKMRRATFNDAYRTHLVLNAIS